jgi:transcriptional regulator with XRE-family HTH domain
MPAAHDSLNDNLLGNYLRDRRAKLDPTAFGFASARRRTPGLRREEVAQRAHVSATWYTWLEQGRGGAPSADVLERIARALVLTEVEREHLFLLALGRPPEVRYQLAEGITPRLQRVLDALEVSPAYVKTSTWDIVGWNRAASAVLTDYGALLPEQRNILRMLFRTPHIRSVQTNWEGVARFAVAGVPRRHGARRGDEECSGLGRRIVPAQPRIRSDLARKRCPQHLWRFRQIPAASACRVDHAGIFGLCRRWPKRSRHGDL